MSDKNPEREIDCEEVVCSCVEYEEAAASLIGGSILADDEKRFIGGLLLNFYEGGNLDCVFDRLNKKIEDQVKFKRDLGIAWNPDSQCVCDDCGLPMRESSNSPEIPDSSPSREWISKMADGEDKCKSVSARNPDAENPEASVVERWGVRGVITLGDEPPYVIEKCRNGQFVKAADHDRIVAEKDAEIAELRAESNARRDALVQIGEERAAEWKRAEAAEAKCAEQKRFAESMLVQAMDAQAQLAAANERAREAYAVLCQLDNVYRRQSTGSIASFSVSKEVHLLLDRAMKILHKE